MELYEFEYLGQTYRYNTGEENIEIDGYVYSKKPINRQDFSFDVKQPELRVTIPIDTLPFSRIINVTALNKMYIKIKTYPDLFILFDGEITNLTTNFPKSTIELKCESKLSLANVQVPYRTFSPSCTWRLYDEYCGLNKSGYSITADKADIVVNSTDPSIIYYSGLADKPDGWYSWGYVELDSGEIKLILKHEGSSVELITPLESLTYASTLTFTAGCDKNIETCKNKFGNEINFGGFPFIPNINPVTEGF